MSEITQFAGGREPMALASFCGRCGAMVGMSMILRRPGLNAAFAKIETAAGRRVETVTVERTRREIVAECACAKGGVR